MSDGFECGARGGGSGFGKSWRGVRLRGKRDAEGAGAEDGSGVRLGP